MYTFIVILILIICVLLAIVVLVQNSKGGGLAANFASNNQYLGVRRTTDFLEKATWWLAGILILLSLAATIAIPRHHDETSIDSNITDLEVPVATPAATPASTATAPVDQAPAQE